MNPRKIKHIVGKWYRGKTGKPRLICRISWAYRVYWSHTHKDSKPSRFCYMRTWRRWVLAGPFDTREEAEKE